MKAKVVAVANNKGGVGKTALVTNVGAAFARKGYKTLLIDLDGQANLTDAFFSENEVKEAIADALSEGKPLPILAVKENLYLAPSSAKTASLEEEIVPTFQETLKPLLPLYDIILIDTPPSIGILTISALFSAEKVIVPLMAEPSSLKGLYAINELLKRVQQGGNAKLKLSAIVLSFYDKRKSLSRIVVEAIEANFKSTLCKNTIRRNIAIAEAGLEHSDVFSYDSRSNGAADYERLSEELLHKMNISANSAISEK